MKEVRRVETSPTDRGDDLQHPSASHDDAYLQPRWGDDDDNVDDTAPAAYGPCDVTDSEITANVPPKRRGEVEKLAEQVRLRAADAELFNAVAAAEFVGKRWQGLSDDLGKYSLAVIDAWLYTGYVFSKVAEKRRPLMPTDNERLQLRTDADLRRQLANGVVGAALLQFRDQALAGAGWRPDGGANLTTYLIGGCVLLFNNEFRLWRGSEKRWRINESTAPEDLVDAENGGAQLRRTGLFAAPAQSTVGGDEVDRALAALKPRERAIVQLYVENYSYDEIAEITNTTARGVEGVLYRLRNKDIRSRMEGHGD
jgi:DNA-directed RNA polymerase specialized sigma24 family protein